LEEGHEKTGIHPGAVYGTVMYLQDIFGFATPQAIYKWQKGTAMPTIDNLVVLAMIFQVKMDDIIVVDVPVDLLEILMESA
jgi:hypothetical protein